MNVPEPYVLARKISHTERLPGPLGGNAYQATSAASSAASFTALMSAKKMCKVIPIWGGECTNYNALPRRRLEIARKDTQAAKTPVIPFADSQFPSI